MAVGKRTVMRWGGYALAWLLFAVPAAIVIFFNSSTSVTVASHDAQVEPSLGNYVTIRTGPFLPDVRQKSGAPIGLDIVLGPGQSRNLTLPDFPTINTPLYTNIAPRCHAEGGQ